MLALCLYCNPKFSTRHGLRLQDVKLHDTLISLQSTDLCCPWHVQWIFQSTPHIAFSEGQTDWKRSISAREFPTGFLRKLSYRVHEECKRNLTTLGPVIGPEDSSVAFSQPFISVLDFFFSSYFKVASNHIPLIQSLLLVKKRSSSDRQPIYLGAVT